MNRQNLLEILPPSYGMEKVIVKDQTVKDIVKEVLDAHREFAPDYDLICEEFADGNTLKRLYDFCKYNLRNDTESEDSQTTTSPTVLLEKGHCDCKGYAGFVGGVLDGLNRAGKGKYNWCYRFAKYDQAGEVNHHVFVVVTDPCRQEVWIDPVLSMFDTRSPFPDDYFDKKVSAMTLSRLSGVRNRGVVPTAQVGCCQALAGYAGRGIGAASSYYDDTGGQVFAVDDSVRPNGMTPDQMGLPYAMEILNRGYEQRHPGTAAAWWANPPVTFWLNGRPYPLPPPNTTVGGPVPLLPLGLTVKYAGSFGGWDIPATFLKPLVVAGSGSGYQNKLRLNSVNLPGLTGPTLPIFGDPTTMYLSSHDSLPLILLEAAIGPLINSFSAYPYANDFSGTNNLDDKMFHHRNADDLLQPSISKTVLQTVAPVAEVLAQGLNFIAPGLGVLAAGAIAAGAGKTKSAVGPGIVDTSSPGASSPAGGVAELASGIGSWISENPVMAAVIAAALGLFVYEIID